jgi:hypothetical protein
MYKDFNSSHPENKSPELFPTHATVNFVLDGLIYSPDLDKLIYLSFEISFSFILIDFMNN